MNRFPPLILATASPRRIELVRQLGLTFQTLPANVDESAKEDESAADYVQRLAEAKARQVSGQHPQALVIGADTVVALDGVLLGKPADARQAASMLRRLSGRTHEVYTGLSLSYGARNWRETVYARTEVSMRRLDDAEIASYVATGEPLDKAGVYAIQGRAAMFVDHIAGCYFNVVGLPLSLLSRMLRRAHRMCSATHRPKG
jgi:septum formation protein